MSCNDAISEAVLPQRKSTLKSLNSVDLTSRHPTSQSEFDFSPKLKERGKRLAFITSVLFESERLTSAKAPPTQNSQVASISTAAGNTTAGNK